MKKKYILFTALAVLLCGACVEDEGNNSLGVVNEPEIEGLEEEYTKLGFQETLEISVDLKGTLSGEDISGYDFKWFLRKNQVASEQEHQVIGTSKDLNFPVNVASGDYLVYFQIMDKATGMKWEKTTELRVTSSFVRGFYLWGDKEDDTCGLDFISMVTGKDTTVIADIYKNSTGMKHAKDLFFTGQYPVNEHVIQLWAIAENEHHAVEHSSMLASFGNIESMKLENKVFPLIDVTYPLRLVGMHPTAYSKSNKCVSNKARVLLTDGDIYLCSAMDYTLGDLYANPINRYSDSSTDLYKPAPYVFYQNTGSYFSTAAYFDETNHCFTANNSGILNTKFTMKCKDDKETPFLLDQTKYNPVRNLVYGENADAYSYALMNDANGDYFIYRFAVTQSGEWAIYKHSAYDVDKSIATDFDKATHYAFFAKQPVVLYAVGTHLYAYNYYLKELKEIENPDGGEITYLAMDFASNNTYTDFIFATYSNEKKGTVYKHTIENNQNDIVVKPHEYETESYPWKTKLKVKKIEYRNSTY